MDGEMFDDVKYEKAKAIARFKRFQRIKKLWKMLVVVTLLSWTSKNIPSAAKFAGEFFFGVSGYVLNSHVVFLIGNAIIVVLFMLCRKSVAGNASGDGEVYGDYNSRRDAQREAGSDSGIELSTEEKETEKEESATEVNVGCGGGGGGRAEEVEEKEMQIVVAENEQCEAVETAIAKATKRIKRFERTQSEKLKREIAVRPARELRRSETEMRRRSITSSAEKTGSVTSSIDTVENLSSEEFKLAIDAFIDKHREFFYIQKMQEMKQLKSSNTVI